MQLYDSEVFSKQANFKSSKRRTVLSRLLLGEGGVGSGGGRVIQNPLFHFSPLFNQSFYLWSSTSVGGKLPGEVDGIMGILFYSMSL